MAQHIETIDDGAENPTVIFTATADTAMGGIAIEVIGTWYTPNQCAAIKGALDVCDTFLTTYTGE